MADKLLQRRPSEGLRGRLASQRAAIQHSAKHTLCWLHLDADTFVSMDPNDPLSLILKAVPGTCC